MKELIANPDRLKARRVMCSTCMSTSSIDSGVLALSCGVSSCCQSAKSDTMRLAPFSLLSCPSLHTHERETRDGQYTHTRGRRRAHRRPLSAPSRPSRSCVRGAPQQLLTRWHPASPGHLPPPPRHHALPLRLPPDCSWPQNFVLFFLVHLIIKHVAQRCDVRRARTTTRTVVLCARYMCPRTVEAPCVRSFAAWRRRGRQRRGLRDARPRREPDGGHSAPAPGACRSCTGVGLAVGQRGAAGTARARPRSGRGRAGASELGGRAVEHFGDASVGGCAL